MNYNILGQKNNGLGKAILGFLMASITFTLGYTVVRTSTSMNASLTTPTGNIYSSVPSEGTLWKKGFKTSEVN